MNKNRMQQFWYSSLQSTIILVFVWLIFFFSFVEAQNQTQNTFLEKFAPSVDVGSNFKKSQTFRLKIKDFRLFEKWKMKHQVPVAVLQISQDSSVILVSVDKAQTLKKLSECTDILFIDRGLRQAKIESENDITGFRVNKIGFLHSLYPDLNGKNLKVSVKERAFDKNDIDLRGRVMDLANFPNTFTNHATEMASLIAGGGNSSPYGKGVAWQADLFTADFANLMPDAMGSLTGREIFVQNHSYGVAIENYYGIETQAYDQQVHENPQLIHIFSAGNSGNLSSDAGTYAGILGFANLTAQFKMSKNTLSIGEIDGNEMLSALSSRGPAYDGRIKPELTAYGGAGTSESAALVSGVSLLIQQIYRNKFNELPQAALVKALLINSAKDLGRPEVDFEYGFGKVDALKTVKAVDNAQFFQDVLLPEGEKIFQIQVPNNTKKLKVTLVWHEQEASINTPKALINDLDLELKHTISGNTWKPWVLNAFPHLDSLKKNAVRGIDRLNNIEQITIDNPESGTYFIAIKAFDIQTVSQNFSVVFGFETESAWTYPSRNDYLQGNEEVVLSWEYLEENQAGVLEFKYTNQTNWQKITDFADVSIGKFVWTLPDTLALFQFRIQTLQRTLLSDTLALAQPIIPKVGFVCENELMLFWKKIEDVTQYEVLKLGEKYLERLAVVSDTLILIDQNTEKGVHYAVSPIFENRNPRGLTINYTFQATDCYVKSFLVRETIQDTLVFDLNLGTTYRLTSATLQRRENGIFQNVQTLTNLQHPFLTFLDKNPLPFKNTYRAELTDNQGRKFYSNEVSAFYIPENDFLIFPNPAQIGDLVTLVDAKKQITQIDFIDSQGRKVQSYQYTVGDFKDILIEDVQPGLYQLVFYHHQNKIGVKKIVIF